MRKIKKELEGVPVSKASANILEEWKKVKASDKKMKKYKDLYEEEKQRHEEVLQRYQEDHMDGIEIINLHKRCNKKARKAPQPKRAWGSGNEKKAATKVLQPKKASGSGKEKKAYKKATHPKKASGSGDEKKAATKVPQPKKAPESPEFIETDDSSDEEEGSKKTLGSSN